MNVLAEIDELLAHGTAAAAPQPADDALAQLPAAVQRWLSWSQVIGKPLPATVRLRQEGEFAPSPKRGWVPFRAEQYFTTEPPGLIWTVRMKLAPLLPVTGRDRWVDGDASMKIRVFGVIPVVNASSPQLAQGAMLRWLGETIWFPHAAVSPHITWAPIDDDSATATFTAGGRSTPATFLFDRDGRPIEIRAHRFNDAEKAVLPWVAINREFGEFHHTHVPVAGEALWQLPASDAPYIRWRITALDFDVPTRW
jgi:hypothetical protein